MGVAGRTPVGRGTVVFWFYPTGDISVKESVCSEIQVHAPWDNIASCRILPSDCFKLSLEDSGYDKTARCADTKTN